MRQIEKPPGVVDLLELKQLLTRLSDNSKLVVYFRFRLSGERWYPNFTKVLSLTDTGVTVVDSSTAKVVTIPDLIDIVQFEIDDRFYNYRPCFHYEVRPLSDTC